MSFIQVKCPKCESTQTVFSKASSTVKCQKCGETLAEPTGGKARIKSAEVKAEQ